jgi:flagellar basal-body rod protein FlgB
MIEGLGGITSEIVKVALDATALRHQVIANNVANAATPGYVPRQVSFEDQLASLVSSFPGSEITASFEREIDGMRNYLDSGEAIQPAIESEVQLDREMVKLTENVLRYQALLEALSKRGALVRMAINEGRR